MKAKYLICNCWKLNFQSIGEEGKKNTCQTSEKSLSNSMGWFNKFEAH